MERPITRFIIEGKTSNMTLEVSKSQPLLGLGALSTTRYPPYPVLLTATSSLLCRGSPLTMYHAIRYDNWHGMTRRTGHFITTDCRFNRPAARRRGYRPVDLGSS